MVIIIIGIGFFPSLLHMFRNPKHLVSSRQWRKSFLDVASPSLLALSDKHLKGVKQDLLTHAHGAILEVGAGTGQTLKYYDLAKVTKVWAVEPDEASVPVLKREILRLGLEGTCEILQCGIEDTEALRNAGIIDGTIDTIVCVLTLCTVPKPRQAISALYPLLKPAGGQLLLLEHVASQNALTRIIQNLYTSLLWPYFTGGCELNRETGTWCVEAIDRAEGQAIWTSVEINPVAGGRWNVFPHIKGRLIKV
jgi:SAM-dependent methyltransferase